MLKNSPRSLSRILNVASRCLAAAGLVVYATVTVAGNSHHSHDRPLVAPSVPTPIVTGPIPSETPGSPGRNYPFFATDMVLSDFGYVEEEFFYDGTANRYDTPNIGGIGSNATSAPTANVVTSGHPFRSRLLVRRPVSEKKFNGTVVVEWDNVTNGYDTDVHWLYQKEFFIREGYAWVGVSAQNNGIGGTANSPKNWSPARYSTLNVNAGGTIPSDLLSYDIYSQAAAAVRRVPAVLGGLRVKNVIAIGQSQSAGRLGIYLNAVHILDPIYDGAILASGGQIMRADMTTPVIKLLTENEYNSSTTIATLQPDSDKMRTWPVAGSSHSEFYSLLSRAAFLLRDLGLQAVDNCATGARSRVANRFVYNAAVHSMVKWVRYGKPPANAPAQQMVSTTPPVVARDEHGNGLGAIRLAEIEVPVAKEAGDTCGLGGTHQPFSAEKLNALYPSHRDYVNKVEDAAWASVKAGFVLREDAEATIRKAQGSIYGRGLYCGPLSLCDDFKMFPNNPSSSPLRDQTDFFAFKGHREAVEIMDEVTEEIATGHSLLATKPEKAQRSFDKAVRLIERYKREIARAAEEGHLRPETLSLLTNQADTLIQKINEL